MQSVEEIRQAAEQFAALQNEAEAAGEQMHADILDTHQSLQSNVQVSGQEYRYARLHDDLASPYHLISSRFCTAIS